MKTLDQITHEISLGEDSTRQFKEKLNNAVQIAQEICAMSNSDGGDIYIGVKDNNTIIGLSADEIRLYNQYISAASSEHIRPAVYPRTQIEELDGKKILIIEVPEGPSKAYCDKDGVYWVKSGSDKRKASPQELVRLFQLSAQISIDETTTSAGTEQIDRAKFFTFFEKMHGYDFPASGLNLEKVLQNMNLAKDGKLTLAGLLLFGDNVQNLKPYCLVRAVAFPGIESSDNVFVDKNDFNGTLEEQFRGSISFFKNNLSHVQEPGASFNSPGVLEISEKALEEAIVNALLHRDYSKNAVIRLFVFKDRVEIISPGSLPNHLSVENIKNGNSVMRNPLLSSYGTRLLPYSGIGSGIMRILRTHPRTEFINDRGGEQFTIILHRR